jgi:hypothetical protein
LNRTEHYKTTAQDCTTTLYGSNVPAIAATNARALRQRTIPKLEEACLPEEVATEAATMAVAVEEAVEQQLLPDQPPNQQEPVQS